MKLTLPFQISSRLLPAVQIGNTYISLEHYAISNDNRDVWTYYIDNPSWEYSNYDFKSGCGGCSIQEAMESLLGFLAAAGESYRYAGMDGENSDLFPEYVVQWCYQNSDELTMMRLELEEAGDLIED